MYDSDTPPNYFLKGKAKARCKTGYCSRTTAHIVLNSNQGFRSPEGTKFHDFSRLRLNSTVSLRPFTGGGGGGWRAYSPRKFLKQDPQIG